MLRKRIIKVVILYYHRVRLQRAGASTMSGFEAVEQAQALIRQVRACWPTLAYIGSGPSDENAVLEKVRQWCGMTETYP